MTLMENMGSIEVKKWSDADEQEILNQWYETHQAICPSCLQRRVILDIRQLPPDSQGGKLLARCPRCGKEAVIFLWRDPQPDDSV